MTTVAQFERSRSLVWLVLTAAVLAAGAFKVVTYPLSDGALFEYFGWTIAHGGHLYTDLWDNKLPSIYYLNAGYQVLFGQAYALHAAADLAIGAVSIGLFALLLRRYGAGEWAWATFLFAIFLILPLPKYDYDEFYAVPLILAAFVLRDRPFAAGILMALSVTFWVASAVLAIVYCLQNTSRARLAWFLLGLTATLAAYAACAIAVIGLHPLEGLVASWLPYFGGGSRAFAAHPKAVVRDLYGSLVRSGAGALLAAFLVVAKRPQNDMQRFALWWVIASLLAACVTAHQYFHYYIPAIAALAFGVAAYAGTAVSGRRLLFAALAAFLLYGTAHQTMLYERAWRAQAATAVAFGERVPHNRAKPVVLYTRGFLPEFYLAAEAVPPDRYAIVYPLGIVQHQVFSAAPDIIVTGAKSSAPPGYAIACRYGRWTAYARDRHMAPC